MMDIRGKLAELLQNAKAAMKAENLSCDIARNMFVVDFMMANGVTVQEWISVEDRLPEESGLYITFGCTAVPVRWLHNFDKDIGKFGAWWNYEPDGKEHPRYRFIEAGNITHWMPLPEPPNADMRGES